MIDLLVIIVDEDSNYVKQSEEFFKKFFEMNHAALTVLLIFSNQGKFQRVTCGTIDSCEDFPNFSPFVNGSDESEIRNWIEEAIVYRQLSLLPADTIEYFYGKPQKVKTASVSSEITIFDESEYRELLNKKPEKPSKLFCTVLTQCGNYEGEIGWFSDYCYGVRDYGTYKLEGFWRFMDIPTGFMKRITNGETFIDYFNKEGELVKNFSKGDATRPWAFIRKLGKYDMHLYRVDDIDILPYCELELKSGLKRQGEIIPITGKLDGLGSEYYVNGDKYHGQFKDGAQHGMGTYYFANGDIYHGGFKDGKFHGKGLMMWSYGDVYEGDFVEGRRTGKGIFQKEDGSVCVGDFIDGKQNGYGQEFLKDGKVYVGPCGDIKDGEAILYFENGTIIVFEWKEGKQSEQFRKFLPSGEIILGTLNNGKDSNELHVTDDYIKLFSSRKTMLEENSQEYTGLTRNAICLCGSGKMYKNCHGKNKI
ncbi:TPA: SEC-C metal-binding domain-containing protein [Streptococcus suis]|nr:SEC-C domain-containing protein [Streptococcus suis]